MAPNEHWRGQHTSRRAASGLDGAGEQALAATLAGLRGQVTVVVVTHRNTLIQHVDKMLVLDGGRVQHYGPAADVMKTMQPPPQRSQVMPLSVRA